jgi:hypothetical protein
VLRHQLTDNLGKASVKVCGFHGAFSIGPASQQILVDYS